MKVALCFLISYEHMVNKEDIWIEWIAANQDIINVYFHYGDLRKIKSAWILKHTIPPKLIQQTRYYDVVPAYLSTMSYAYAHDIENVWFCMLTESCVPIISPEKFRALFKNHFQASIMKWRPAYWNINMHRRANLYLLTQKYWLSNDPWFTLSRNHVSKCLIFLSTKTDIYNIVNKGGLANESIFAIILQTFNQLTNTQLTVNELSTVADWSRMSSPTSPYIFKDATAENVEKIHDILGQNKYAMFLRKVDAVFPDSAIKNMMYHDFGHEYAEFHNSARQQNKKWGWIIHAIQWYGCWGFLLFMAIYIHEISIMFVDYAKHARNSMP